MVNILVQLGVLVTWWQKKPFRSGLKGPNSKLRADQLRCYLTTTAEHLFFTLLN